MLLWSISSSKPIPIDAECSCQRTQKQEKVSFSEELASRQKIFERPSEKINNNNKLALPTTTMSEEERIAAAEAEVSLF